MALIKQKFIYRQDLKDHPNNLYLFGDNMAREGMGGQAKEMRGEVNAVGIITKVRPAMGAADFLGDSDLNEVLKDYGNVYNYCKKFKDFGGADIVVPADGIGTGLALLETKSPKCWNALQFLLEKLEEL
ncbi:MAG: hypothetical protein QF855_01825 [Candidatus Pacebacteria bacterium]|jgi:hypothetical protein|nr:hypothetical protein [Candidatus Paceibacterota bacterium]|tara:strand:+ start:762 stop:1148 length:387 start_codon:yes stop_codon:yes gene_type:complete